MTNANFNTAVLGYFGYQNAGDDAFHDFWSRTMGVPDASLLKNLRGLNVKSPVLGGGAIVNEYFISRLPESFDRLSLYGCSFPYGPDDIQLLAPFAGRIGDIHLRSKRDAEAARELFPSTRYVPDLVFGHDFAERHITIEEIVGQCEVPPIEFDFQRKNLFLLLSDHYRPGELSRHFLVESFKYRIAETLDYLSEFYNIICLPMSMWHDSRDNVFAADVVSRMRMREKVAAIDRYLGPDYIFQAIKSQASLVVSMKYHGIVFAMCAGVPFINVGDTRKNQDLLVDSGLGALESSMGDFDRDRFLAAVKVAESADTRELILDTAARNREEVQAAMKAIGKNLDFSPV
ncbi:polysaccharide pyruvyl transferase family protein [Pseudoduganella albidiflava]|uniref:Polysaccharide pyruvyl transferase domain-containing protein n=1 Tax=Pseudoduganella albidiflava TaxID=321983 RepID=A0A411WTZ2_9BURK|nr:polysaccharide pyruvyl transferase family protein [Pseudoduganella albidiflava]QBI00164.1 hypothetical protein EYF70_04355 [Pseudoduganella albidiflava]GGY66318.1 hypothetical protein GCM10007387_55730 [Pseudoduganella albidiflava]